MLISSVKVTFSRSILTTFSAVGVSGVVTLRIIFCLSLSLSLFLSLTLFLFHTPFLSFFRDLSQFLFLFLCSLSFSLYLCLTLSFSPFRFSPSIYLSIYASVYLSQTHFPTVLYSFPFFLIYLCRSIDLCLSILLSIFL